MVRIEHKEPVWEFPFVEYSPENADGKLPLVIQLHGAGERGWGEDLNKVEIHGFPEKMDLSGYPCLFVFPQCPPDTFWVARIESILRFIDQIVEKYNVDEDRIYLTGYSMGGYGTWFTAQAAPNRFAAIVPICGGGMAWNTGVLRMPVWVFHGVEDPTVDVFHSDEMVEKLKKAGREVRYDRMEGVQHRAWEQACRPEVLDWLLQQKKK